VIDPIEELAKIALKHKVGLHVDCCLGGFYLPFAKRDESLTVPKFDFSVEGVSSISVDTHKVKLKQKF
jgi:sphinganine-1-phosphate aldolase